MGFLSYLLMHVWLCLLAAALLGGFLMWLVSKFLSNNLREELETLWGGKVRAAESRAGTLSADLIRLEGKLPALEAQIADWKAKFAALEADKANVASRLAGELSILTSEHQTGIAAAAATTAAASVAATARFSALEDERRALEARFEQARQAHAEQTSNHEASLAGFSTQLQALSGDLTAARTQLAAAQHSANQHSRQLQQVAQERDRSSIRVRGLSDELAAARQSAAPLAMSATAGAASSLTLSPPVADE